MKRSGQSHVGGKCLAQRRPDHCAPDIVMPTLMPDDVTTSGNLRQYKPCLPPWLQCHRPNKLGTGRLIPCTITRPGFQLIVAATSLQRVITAPARGLLPAAAVDTSEVGALNGWKRSLGCGW
jgi:hypothetical protein